MTGTLNPMKALLVALVTSLVACGCGSDGSSRKAVALPPPATVNLMVQSPHDASIWHMQYRKNGEPWTPEDPEKGIYVDANAVRSIADVTPATYDFVYDLKPGPFSSFIHRERCCVEVYPDEHGDFLFVVPER